MRDEEFELPKYKVGDTIEVLGYARRVLPDNRDLGGSEVLCRAFDGTEAVVVEEYFATVVFEFKYAMWEVYKTACRRARKEKS